ncbi:MAG: hypothetical protein R3181_01315 [Rubricoccaceae bacterium]|nr:hypothetical protein [Rubricoccaceae bacterium]
MTADIVAVTTSERLPDRLRPYLSSLVLLPCCFVFAVADYDVEGAFGWLRFIAHSVNLLPHEAGHFFFRFFGTFMMFAGGTIWQLVFPCIFVWYCVSNDLKVGLQVSLLWLGQNFVDVSVYAADAQARALPLIGGLGPEAHDWYNMLAMLGLLEHTPLIAGLLYACAFPIWALMLAVPRWVW